MICRDCRETLVESAKAGVLSCPTCGYSAKLTQPVAMTGRTTLTKAGDVRVIDGTARTAEVQP
jgi:uncharacterized Zn finger protein (UPF0148 family)